MSEQQNPVTQDEIHAYVDGTLSEARRVDVERELERNPELAARASDFFALNNLLHERYDRVLAEPLPARLRVAAPQPQAQTVQNTRPAANWPRFAGLAATLVLGVAIGWGMHYGMSGAGGPAGAAGGELHTVSADGSMRFAQQAALAHVVYMPTVVRPDTMDDSQEQDFVKWLANRLGTNVRAPMLSKSGFELSGGRLLQADDGGEVAQFMYHNAKGERVTLCISHRKTSANTTAFKLYQDGPVNVFYWVDGDFGYALSGGIDRKALLQLAHDVYAQLTPS
ncbi:anti-sigma factor family protein [Paraburkholderia acidiphila]|uniref:Anti-sigma factor n=1 Tax=Paraburkholderia acidiphila TaxID=2571747 RepID=A0A7Z2GDA1_9BURK|nr:anti-sigma factor [Paraburkholderia acidiphila]QGZ59581.1 anti-sigma factor [Paraburkholderia acidiphila]